MNGLMVGLLVLALCGALLAGYPVAFTLRRAAVRSA